MDDFPDVLLAEVLGRLSLREAARSESVCRKWRAVGTGAGAAGAVTRFTRRNMEIHRRPGGAWLSLRWPSFQSCLTSLHLDWVPCNDLQLQGITKLTSLTDLHLSDLPQVTDASVILLCTACTRLHSLALWDMDAISDRSMPAVATLRSLWSFKIISDGEKLSNKGLRSLGSASLATSLTSLVMSAPFHPKTCFLDAESFDMIATQFPRLEFLNLSCISPPHPGGYAVLDRWNHGLQHLTRLRYLDSLMVMASSVNSTGLAHICGIPSLTFLDVNNSNLITDAGLKHLGRLRYLTALELHCESDLIPFSDEGLSGLAARATRAMRGSEEEGSEEEGSEEEEGSKEEEGSEEEGSTGDSEGYFWLEHLDLRGSQCLVDGVPGPNLRTLLDAGVDVKM